MALKPQVQREGSSSGSGDAGGESSLPPLRYVAASAPRMLPTTFTNNNYII